MFLESFRLHHLILCLLLSSCSGSPVPERPRSSQIPPAEDAALPEREEFVRRGLRPLGSSRASLTQALGKPDSTVARTIPNRHAPSETDTLFAVHYPGLTVHIHRPYSGRELLSRVDVTENEYLRYHVLGLSARAVEDAFGAPDERSESTLTYLCTSCVAGDDPVRLFVREGRIQRVEFNFYVD